jgi:hypothetical protein
LSTAIRRSADRQPETAAIAEDRSDADRQLGGDQLQD